MTEDTDSPSKKAQSILDELRAIIEEQEGTIADQQTQIENLLSEVDILTKSRDGLLDKVQQMEKLM